MTATPSIELPAWMAEQLSQASPDLLRQMVQIFAEALMSADAVCGAGYGQRSPDRRNTRNGYGGGVGTRAGSIELAVPKLREGSYFPDWLLERRRRAESALVSVVATSYPRHTDPGPRIFFTAPRYARGAHAHGHARGYASRVACGGFVCIKLRRTPYESRGVV